MRRRCHIPKIRAGRYSQTRTFLRSQTRVAAFIPSKGTRPHLRDRSSTPSQNRCQSRRSARPASKQRFNESSLASKQCFNESLLLKRPERECPKAYVAKTPMGLDKAMAESRSMHSPSMPFKRAVGPAGGAPQKWRKRVRQFQITPQPENCSTTVHLNWPRRRRQ